MAEALANTLHDPPHPIESVPTPVMETQQADLRTGVNKIAGHISGMSPSVLHETEWPLGRRPILKGSSTRSRSRGRLLNRSLSRGKTHFAGGGSRSNSKTIPVKKSAMVGQTPSRPLDQMNQGPTPRTWANVARVQTKGYSLDFIPPIEENGEVIVDISPEIAAHQNPLWKECIVGHYVGRKVPFKLTEEAVKKAWGDHVLDIKLHENGFYFFECRMWIIAGRYWI